MRAKFRCNSVKYYGDADDANTPREYELSAVYDTRTEENRRFAKATPTGNLSIRVDNPTAHLQVGEEYYLDFTATALAQHHKTPETMGNVHPTPASRYEPGVRTVPDVTGTEPMPARHAASEAAPSSKGYTDLTTTQPMNPAEVTTEDDETKDEGNPTEPGVIVAPPQTADVYER